jgi:hypothetical protein
LSRTTRLQSSALAALNANATINEKMTVCFLRVDIAAPFEN